MTDSTLLNQDIDSLILNKYVLKFKPNNLDNKNGFKLLNKLIFESSQDNYQIDFNNKYITLIILNTTTDIYNYLKSMDIEKYAINLLPPNSGHFNKTNTCFINNFNNIISNDIAEFIIAHPMLKNNKNTTAIMYNQSSFINIYIDIIRKYIVNLVMNFLKNKYKNNIDNLYLEETNKYILIYILDKVPSITDSNKYNLDISNINFNNYRDILKSHKNIITKIILFKFKINKFIPHISLNKFINKNIINDINKNNMLKNEIFNSKINLFEGNFSFL